MIERNTENVRRSKPSDAPQAYIVVGCVCLFLALIFSIVVLSKPREMGDVSFLSWNKQKLQ